MSNNQRRHVPGISVYKRGNKWAHLVTGIPDVVTGEAERAYKGGFETEDDAWNAALKLKAQFESGRVVKPSSRTVEQFLTEWLPAVEHSIKPSTFSNYRTNSTAYVFPLIGKRKLQGEFTVPLLNEFYVRLLQNGRVKVDNNTRMYEYWLQHKDKRDGLGPGPTEVSRECGTSYHAARKATYRFQHGRIPKEQSEGLSVKSVKNIHRMLHLAAHDAVAWGYLTFNPAEHASLPRQKRQGRRRKQNVAEPWSLQELACWLQVALRDRFAGMWVLAATTGARRSELAGAERDLLNFEDETLEFADTRVVVDGNVIEEDGKSEAGNRTVSLDKFTLAALRRHVAMLDEERKAFGTGYENTGNLFVWENGKCPHPDTITDRFNRLVDLAGVRRIRLHDVRHTYATLSLDSGMDVKLLSDRVGHAKLLQDYIHRSTGKDKPAANVIGKLIYEAMTEPVQWPLGEAFDGTW